MNVRVRPHSAKQNMQPFMIQQQPTYNRRIVVQPKYLTNNNNSSFEVSPQSKNTSPMKQNCMQFNRQRIVSSSRPSSSYVLKETLQNQSVQIRQPQQQLQQYPNLINSRYRSSSYLNSRSVRDMSADIQQQKELYVDTIALKQFNQSLEAQNIKLRTQILKTESRMMAMKRRYTEQVQFQHYAQPSLHTSTAISFHNPNGSQGVQTQQAQTQIPRTITKQNIIRFHQFETRKIKLLFLQQNSNQETVGELREGIKQVKEELDNKITEYEQLKKLLKLNDRDDSSINNNNVLVAMSDECVVLRNALDAINFDNEITALLNINQHQSKGDNDIQEIDGYVEEEDEEEDEENEGQSEQKELGSENEYQSNNKNTYEKRDFYKAWMNQLEIAFQKEVDRLQNDNERLKAAQDVQSRLTRTIEVNRRLGSQQVVSLRSSIQNKGGRIRQLREDYKLKKVVKQTSQQEREMEAFQLTSLNEQKSSLHLEKLKLESELARLTTQITLKTNKSEQNTQTFQTQLNQQIQQNNTIKIKLQELAMNKSHRYIGSDESGDENRPRGKSGRIGRKGSIASQKSSERDSLMFTQSRYGTQNKALSSYSPFQTTQQLPLQKFSDAASPQQQLNTTEHKSAFEKKDSVGSTFKEVVAQNIDSQISNNSQSNIPKQPIIDGVVISPSNHQDTITNHIQQDSNHNNDNNSEGVNSNQKPNHFNFYDNNNTNTPKTSKRLDYVQGSSSDKSAGHQLERSSCESEGEDSNSLHDGDQQNSRGDGKNKLLDNSKHLNVDLSEEKINDNDSLLLPLSGSPPK